MKGTFTELDLRILEDKPEYFEVISDCTYTNELVEYTVKEGTETDLASIPPWLRPFFSRTGRNRKPAVFHDDMYGKKWKTRKECDRMFKRMLKDQGVSSWKATLYYLGVRSGGWTRGNW